MMRTVLVLAVVATACAPAGDVTQGRESLLQADRAFARATAERGIDGWVESFAEQGVMFRSGGLVNGRREIRDYMGPVFADTTFSLMWEPQQAHVAEAGDMGYTVGRYESRRVVADGGGRVSTGSYVTIWEKQVGGAWRVVLDIGTPDDPAGTESPEP